MFEQGFGLERLEQEVAGTGPHRLDRTIDVGESGHQHDREVRIAVADFLEQGDAVHRHHAHIADDEGNGLRIQQPERLFAARGRYDRLAGQFERIAYGFAQVEVVFDDQNG